MAKEESKLDIISKLVDLFKEKELGEFAVEIKEDDSSHIKIKIANNVRETIMPTHISVPKVSDAASPLPVLDESTTETKGLVTSEMVGTAYLKPSPEAETPFVHVGQSVKEGDTILIIEAMKTMNFIAAPHAGTVRKIMVDDGEPVQFGSELMVID